MGGGHGGPPPFVALRNNKPQVALFPFSFIFSVTFLRLTSCWSDNLIYLRSVSVPFSFFHFQIYNFLNLFFIYAFSVAASLNYYLLFQYIYSSRDWIYCSKSFNYNFIQSFKYNFIFQVCSIWVDESFTFISTFTI